MACPELVTKVFTGPRFSRRLAVLAFTLVFACLLRAPAAPLAVIGETVFTSAGEPITNGVVLIEGRTITRVGLADVVSLPPDARILRARVVTPGLIDAHSVVGLSGILNQKQDQEQLDPSAPLQPELRAMDAFNPRDPLVAWVRSFGVTTLHTGHAPGAVIAGQTMIVKTWPENTDDAVVVPAAMLAGALGPAALSDKREKPPASTPKAIALLRAELVKAQEYAAKRAKADAEKRPARDLRLDALVPVLERKLPLLVTVNRHQDILSALRVAREFDLRMVLDSVADVPLVLDELKRSGLPVIVHPTMARASGERENLSLETAGKLRQAAIPFAFQSGYEGYVPKTRVVLFEAAMATANGLSPRDALAALTIDAARLLGVQERTGSLEPGKDADLALYDGDPFEFTTHCVGVVVSGTALDGEKK